MIKLYRFDVDYLDEERGIKHIPCDNGDYVLAEDALALQAKVEEAQVAEHEADHDRQKAWDHTDDLQAKVEELTGDRDLYKATCMADDALIKQLQAKVEELEDEIRYRDGMKALENQIKPKENE